MHRGVRCGRWTPSTRSEVMSSFDSPRGQRVPAFPCTAPGPNRRGGHRSLTRSWPCRGSATQTRVGARSIPSNYLSGVMISSLIRSRGLVEAIWCQWLRGKAVWANTSASALARSAAPRGTSTRGFRRPRRAGSACVGRRLGVDPPHGGGDHVPGCRGHGAQDVAHQMDVSGGAGEHTGTERLQPDVPVGDHESDSAEAWVLGASQERGPEHLAFALSPTSTPSTSRSPLAVTPVATPRRGR
jgi:hypothetical protein